MTEHQPSAGTFPDEFRRIIASWYAWQCVYLWTRKRRPGDTQRPPEKWETADEVFWGARPPAMADPHTLFFATATGGTYFYLTDEDGTYYVDSEERGTRVRLRMFRALEDAEKYLLLAISQDARPGKYTDSPRSRWRRAGLHPRVTLAFPDPEKLPGRATVTVDDEGLDRGWMGRNEAIAFSHAIILTFEELDQTLRQGIPVEAFENTPTA